MHVFTGRHYVQRTHKRGSEPIYAPKDSENYRWVMFYKWPGDIWEQARPSNHHSTFPVHFFRIKVAVQTRDLRIRVTKKRKYYMHNKKWQKQEKWSLMTNFHSLSNGVRI